MIEWWTELGLLGQIFFIIGFSATLILIIQTILLMFGVGFGGGDSDVSDVSEIPDFDDIGDIIEVNSIDNVDVSDIASSADGLSLFTIRGLVAFFSVGGWVGLILLKSNLPSFVAVLGSVISGFLALVGIAYIFKFAYKLQSNGTKNIKNAVGKTAKVYIPIPQLKSGTGKINVIFQDTYAELDAVTDDTEVLKTGEMVNILSIVDNQTVLVTSAKTQLTNKNTSQGGISKWIQ